MQCPVCRLPAIVVEHEGIELDYCTRCRGVWFDTGELELLIEKLDIPGDKRTFSGMLHAPAETPREEARRCPVCGGRMEKAAVGSDPEVVVDRCRRDDGIWFDGGELERVVKMVGEGRISGEAALRFLGRVFGGTRQ